MVRLLSLHIPDDKARADLRTSLTEFTNQLEGYEGVTAQCHNCECILIKVGMRWDAKAHGEAQKGKTGREWRRNSEL